MYQGYDMVFTSFYTIVDNEEVRHDSVTLNLACDNGYWTGRSHPLLPASGWHEMPDNLQYWDDQEEEASRFKVLTSYDKVVNHFWYEYRWFGNQDHPTQELVWTGDRRHWERTDGLGWCPYPDWEFLPSSGRMGATCFG